MTDAPARRALLIGIDQYAMQPDVIRPLSGCVNDVDAMERILRAPPYAFENVRVLRNAEATRDGILGALDALVAETGPDDMVVIQYSGHGSQKWNASGDEASGWDSTIVPVDSGRKPLENRDITDEEISARLEALGRKTPYATLVFDSCHSGTITRDTFAMSSRGVPPDAPDPADVPNAATRSAAAAPPPTRGVGKRAAASGDAGSRYVVISGCRDEETSWEYRTPPEEGSVAHGALSYFLLREMVKPGRRSYRDLYEAVAPLVTAYKGQHPQIEGRVDGEVLGVGVIPPMAYVRVSAVDGGTITLEAGAAHRVTVGSEYDVYRPGTAQPTDADRVARVRVTHVHAVHAEAEPLGAAAPDAVAVGARAVEAVHAFGDLRLRVWVDDTVTASTLPEAARLRELLAQSRKVQLVDSTGDAAARVTLLTPGNTSAAPRVVGVDAPTFATVDGVGEPVGPLKAAAEVEQLATNLDTYAAWRDTLTIENPDQQSALRGAVTLDLLRRVSDATQPKGFRWEAARPERPGGDVVFTVGEHIAFRITNHHTEPVFVNLLDLSVDGEIAVLYPRKSDTVERVGTERAFSVWRKSQEGFEVLWPETYPFVPGDTAAEAVDVVKLFVTTREARFDAVAQAAQRSAGERSRVEALLRGAYAGERKVDTSDDEDDAVSASLREEDWTTVQARFVTRRAGAAAQTTTPEVPEVGVPNVPAAAPAAAPAGIAAALGVGGEARDAAERALGGAGLAVQQRFEIAESPAGAGQRDIAAERRVDVAAPEPGFGQMVLTTDASGMVSWHFAQAPAPAPATTDGGRDAGAAGAADVRSYVIPSSAPVPGTGEPGERGLVSAGVRKLVEVVVFPLVEDAVGPVGAQYVERWEATHRPYRLRTFTPDDYASPDGASVSGATLAEGRALLMVHGTFSRAHSAFGAFPRDVVSRLHERYGGRVFAFDHFTLSHDPEQNVRWLLDQLPAGATLDVDIVCHSRGGLVSRVLAERHADRARVGTVVFVGAPNAGTALADADRVGKFVDTYTNLLGVMPTNGVTDVLEGIVAVAKSLAVGVAKALPGLQAMRPGGELLTQTLNAAGAPAANGTRYYALSSNYDPRPATPGLNALLMNRLMDKVFDAENDLVVPTASTYAANGSARFPIADAVVFRGDDSVAHTEFFGRPAVHERLLGWLGA
jgi:hypothetical protein